MSLKDLFILSPVLRRRGLWTIRTLLILDFIYVVGALVFLNGPTLRRLVNSDPNEIKLDYSFAYSTLPGWVYVRGLQFRIQDSNIQTYFTLEKVRVSVDLFSLRRKEFHAYSVSGDGLSFHLRFRREPEEVSGGLLATLPEIPGLPSLSKSTVKEEGPFDSWQARIDRVKVSNVNDLWFEEYRFLGRSRVRGGFFLRPKQLVEVTSASWDIEEGQVLLADEGVANLSRTSLKCELSRLSPSDYPGPQILKQVSAELNANAQIENLQFLNFYLQEVGWLSISGGKGSLIANLKVDRGKFSPGSLLRAQSDGIELNLWRQKAVGKGEVSWLVQGKENPTGELAVLFKEYQLSHIRQNNIKVLGSDLKITLTTPAPNLINPLTGVSVQLSLPEAKINDLGYCNQYLPRGSQLKIVSGTGLLSATVTASAAQNSVDHGEIRLVGKGAIIQFDKLKVRGDVELSAILSNANLRMGELDITGTRIRLSRVTHSVSGEASDSPQKDWWGQFTLNQAKFDIGKEPRLKASVEMDGRNAEPLLNLYFEQVEKLPPWLKDILTLEGLSISLDLNLNDEKLRLGEFKITGGDVEIVGWMERSDVDRQGRVLVRYGPLAAGVEVAGKNVNLRLHDAINWYRMTNALKPPPK